VYNVPQSFNRYSSGRRKTAKYGERPQSARAAPAFMQGTVERLLRPPVSLFRTSPAAVYERFNGQPNGTAVNACGDSPEIQSWSARPQQFTPCPVFGSEN